MSEPTSALSIEGLVLRVARESGIAFHGATGQERAMIPIDDDNLDLCLRIVNDGIRLFIASPPAKGWRWMRRLMSVTMTSTRVEGTADAADSTSITDLTLADTYDTNDDLNGWYVYITDGTGEGSYAQITDYTGATGKITVSAWLDVRGNTGGTTPAATDSFVLTPVETVGGDIHRYPLPENFGGSPDGEIHYAENTNHAAHIDWRDEAFIRRRRSVTVISSYPLYAALRQLEPYASGATPKRRFEIIFDPEPVADDTVEFPYSVFTNEVRMETGGSSAGDTTSLTDSDLAALYPDDYFNGWLIKIISGTGKNSYALVTDYAGSTGAFTVADWLSIDGSAGGTDPSGGTAPEDKSYFVVTPVTDLHPAGYRFDDYVLSACMARAEIEVEDLTGRGFVENFYKIDVKKAHALDRRSAPRTLGSSNVNSTDKNSYRERTFNDITFN
jgi:hypothetical protein